MISQAEENRVILFRYPRHDRISIIHWIVDYELSRVETRVKSQLRYLQSTQKRDGFGLLQPGAPQTASTMCVINPSFTSSFGRSRDASVTVELFFPSDVDISGKETSTCDP